MIFKIVIAFALLLMLSFSTVAQQRSGSLTGQVTDELGGLVVGATVTIISSEGVEKTAVTNGEGTYTFNSLAPGRYTLKVVASGFSNYENSDVEVKASRNTHQVRLAIAMAKQLVTVDDGRRLNTDSENNADAVVLRGADIDVLPDDPDALAAAAQAMAGPSAGPNGAQIFIDGFTGGRMPPKESIREVRINQNPFFFFYSYGDHRDLHSFPTRRYSGLGGHRAPRGSRPRRHPEARRGSEDRDRRDRKSTRLNSSHVKISYAVFCLKKKKKKQKNLPFENNLLVR